MIVNRLFFLSFLGGGDVLLMYALRYYDITLLSVGVSIQSCIYMNRCNETQRAWVYLTHVQLDMRKVLKKLRFAATVLYVYIS